MRIIMCFILIIVPTSLFAENYFNDNCVTCSNGSGWAVDVIIMTDEDNKQEYIVFKFADSITVIPRIKTSTAPNLEQLLKKNEPTTFQPKTSHQTP